MDHLKIAKECVSRDHHRGFAPSAEDYTKATAHALIAIAEYLAVLTERDQMGSREYPR